MKILTKTIKAYTYNELSESAKEKVKQMILHSEIRNNMFYEQVMDFLHTTFTRSDLKIQYSLSYSQGDGFNIYGSLNLYDFIELWEVDNKSKRTMEFYCEFLNEFKFTVNNSYDYSYKFIDKKYIDDEIDEHINILEYNSIKNINTELLTKFYNDMIDYFAERDTQFEKTGYKYLYTISDEEVEEECAENEWCFDATGNYIYTSEYVEV